MRDNRRPRYQEVDVEWLYKHIQTRLGDEQLNPCQLRGYIEQVIYTVCNYINRSYVPEPLKFVVLNMTMDLLKSEALNGFVDNDKLSDIGLGSLSKIEDGDSQLQFRTGGSSATTGVHTANPEEILYNYKIQLDKYRLTRW
jgi:hypothetical protein